MARTKQQGRKPKQKGKEKKNKEERSVDENTVGITLFRNPKEGFQGTVRGRSLDYIVREISCQGKVCQLTHLPPKGAERVAKKAQPNVREEGDLQSINIVCEKLRYDVSPQSLRSFLLQDSAHPPKYFLIPKPKKKQSMLHQTIKQHIGAFVTSEKFKSADGMYHVRLQHRSVRKKGASGQQNKKRERKIMEPSVPWPSDTPDYLNFTLYKDNRKMAFATQEIARKLQLDESQIHYASKIDVRPAITSQLCQVYHIKKERFAEFEQNTSSNVIIGDLQYTHTLLQAGDLKGYQYHFVIRDVSVQDPTKEDDIIQRCAQSLSQDGFINYFDPQQFMFERRPVHEIGRALWHKNWSLVCDLILKPREREQPAITAVREAFAATKDVEKALSMFPPHLTTEISVLRGLKEHGSTQYQQALDHLPRDFHQMCIRAYQKFIWNTAVSYRIETYGYSVVVGDLIVPSGVESLYYQIEKQESTETPLKKVKTEDNITVRAITQQDIDAGTFTVKDIVLPVPGLAVCYPENQVAEVYRNSLMNSISDCHVPGEYRPIIGIAKDMEYQLVRYDDVKKPLIPTDIDIIMNKSKMVGDPHGKHRALCCKFTLASSTCITMCLRELMMKTS